MSGARTGNDGRWLWRAVRGIRPDRNPLRRRTDRLEACLLAGLFTAGAVATPFAAQAASHAAYQGALQARQEQLTTRHQVRAALTETAGPVGGYALTTAVLVPASWTSVQGVRRSGAVPARPESPAGTLVPVWTDANGYLASPPLVMSEVTGDADAARAGAVGGMAVLCVAGATAIRQLLNRRRMAAWEADWLATAPTWNRQRW
jgi:hypothetical protein